MSKRTSIYIPEDTHKKLQAMASKLDISVNTLILKGVDMILQSDATPIVIEEKVASLLVDKPTTFGAAEFPVCEMEDYDFCAEQDSSKIDFRVVDSTGFALWRWNQENNRYEPNTKGLQHMLFYKWRRNYPDTKKVASSSKTFNSKVMLPIKHEPVEIPKSLTDLDNLLTSALSKIRNADEVDC